MAGTEVAQAYVTIIPKTESQGTFDKVIKSAAGAAGDAGGKRLGDGLMSGVTSFGGKAAKVIAAGVAAGVGAAGIAIGGFAKSSIEAGKSFDSSMSQVAATMGKTVDEIGNLRDFAQEMGAKTAFSASESADALNYMALAGYDAETSMKMLPNVLNLAASGGIELAAASDMVTDAQSALGLTIDQTTEMVDQMAKTASTTNTSVEQLGSAFLTVGGTAKIMQGGTAELSQVLGLLADNGVKGAEGGTALRNILLSLSAPTDKAAARLDALGVAVFDSEGNMRSMKDVMLDLNGAMADMTDEERTQSIAEIFNARDLKSVNALLGTSADRWDQVAASIGDAQGAAEKMAQTQLDNLEGDITIFNSALEGTQIALSDALTPALREFVQFGTDELGKLTDVLKSDDFSAFAADFASGVTSAVEGMTAAVADFSAGFSEGFDASAFTSALEGVGVAVGNAFGDGGDASPAKSFGSMLAESLNIAAGAITAVTPLIEEIAGGIKFLADNAEVALPVIGGIAGALLAINGASAVAGVVTTIGGALSAIGIGGGAAAGGLAATAGGTSAAGAAASGAAPPLLELGAAVLMVGGGIALAAAGMWLLADAAVSIADAGVGAGVAMAGMVVGIAALAVVFSALGPGLAVATPGMLAFGAAILMVGGGVALASAGLSMLAGNLPQIASSGTAAGVAIAAIGAGTLVLGGGAMVAGAGLVVMGGGLTVAAAALAVATPAMAAAAGGATLLGGALGLMAGAVLDVGKGAADMGWGLSAAGDAMPEIADNALGAGIGIGQLADAMARASANLTQGSSSMTAAGRGASALAAGVTASTASAAAAAISFAAMGAAASAAFRAIQSDAAATGNAVRSALSGLYFTAFVTFSLGAMPHFRMVGEFDAKSGAVPTIAVDWYATGGIFPANAPRVIGVGDAREPEVVQPLSHLQSMLDSEPKQEGGDTYIIRNLTFDSSSAVGQAFGEAFRMAGIYGKA